MVVRAHQLARPDTAQALAPDQTRDPMDTAMLVHEPVHHFSRRSSSSWAKNPLATFRVWLARCSSFTSRSRTLMRCASSVLTPGPVLASTSDRLTQSNSVCGSARCPLLGRSHGAVGLVPDGSPADGGKVRLKPPRSGFGRMFVIMPSA